MRRQNLVVVTLSTLLIAGVVGGCGKTVSNNTTEPTSIVAEVTTEVPTTEVATEEVTVAGVVEETTGVVVAEGESYTVVDLVEQKIVKAIEDTAMYELYDAEGNVVKEVKLDSKLTVTGTVYCGDKAYGDWYYAVDDSGVEGYIDLTYFSVEAPGKTNTAAQNSSQNQNFNNWMYNMAMQGGGTTFTGTETGSSSYTGEPSTVEVNVTLE